MRAPALLLSLQLLQQPVATDSRAAGSPPSSPPRLPLPRLIFEIGEGFPNSLVASTKNETAAADFRHLDAQLDNIYRALLPLTQRYTVDVLLYPCHLIDYVYAPGSAGTRSRGPLEKLHPGLLRMMEFFEANVNDGGIGVFIEAYSSGIITQQVGPRNGATPATPLRNSTDSRRYLGLSIDLETVGAMKVRYPRAMTGVRFHEVFGCDSVWRGDGQKDCFQLAPEVFTGFIDLCAQKDMIFYHNDQTWLMRHDMTGSAQWSYHKDSPAYYLAKLLEGNTSSTVDYASRKLGKRALLSYENNNGAVLSADLAFFTSKADTSNTSVPIRAWEDWHWPFAHFPLRNQSNGWGISNQPWAWSEFFHTLTALPYMNHGEMFAPVEFMAQFAVHAIEEQADVLHFEPSWYWFDEFFPDTDDPVALESPTLPSSGGLPSHSERMALRRLKAVLLAKAGALPKGQSPPLLPSGDLGTTFDRDQQVFLSNRAAVPPLNFKESDLLVLDRGDNSLATTSCYNDGRRWQRQPPDVPTFTPNVTTSAVALLGIELTGDFVSELAKVTVNATHAIVDFYFSWSGHITSPLAVPLEDNGCTLGGPGTLGYSFVAGNFIRTNVFGAQGDPDELLLVRRCPGHAAAVFELWQMEHWEWQTVPEREAGVGSVDMAWKRAPISAERAVVQHLIGPAEIASASLVAVIGRHAERSAEVSVPAATRPLDHVFVVALAAGSGSNDETDLPCGAELHAVCGDACHAADPLCSFACVQCAGDHQRALQAAGCDNEAIIAFCAGPKKPGAPTADLEVRIPAALAAPLALKSWHQFAQPLGNSYQVVGAAGVDIDSDGDDELVLLSSVDESVSIFALGLQDRQEENAQGHVEQLPSADLPGLPCRTGLQCIVGSRRQLIPTIGPPGPAPPLCVAPCGEAGKGASGTWLATLAVKDACECECACQARAACVAWQLATVGADKGTCWLKSTAEMGVNAASTSGLKNISST
jgi:hypothetical protein